MNLCMRRLPSESYNNSEELGLHRWRRRRIRRDQRDSEEQSRSPMLHFLLMTTALTGVHLQMLVEIQYASAVLIRKLNLQGPRNVSNKLSQIIVSMELKILECETPVTRWQPMGADWCAVVLWARRAEMIQRLCDTCLCVKAGAPVLQFCPVQAHLTRLNWGVEALHKGAPSHLNCRMETARFHPTVFHITSVNQWLPVTH